MRNEWQPYKVFKCHCHGRSETFSILKCKNDNNLTFRWTEISDETIHKPLRSEWVNVKVSR